MKQPALNYYRRRVTIFTIGAVFVVFMSATTAARSAEAVPSACAILTAPRSTFVYGVPANIGAGQLCSDRSACVNIPFKGGAAQIMMKNEPGDLVSFAGTSSTTGTVRCAVVVQDTAKSPIQAQIPAIVAGLAGLLSGLLVTWSQRAIAARGEREIAIVGWIEEYDGRLRAFLADGQAAPAPAPPRAPQVDLIGHRSIVRVRNRVLAQHSPDTVDRQSIVARRNYLDAVHRVIGEELGASMGSTKVGRFTWPWGKSGERRT